MVFSGKSYREYKFGGRRDFTDIMGHVQHRDQVLCTSVRSIVVSTRNGSDSTSILRRKLEVHYNEEILHDGLIRGANPDSKKEASVFPWGRRLG